MARSAGNKRPHQAAGGVWEKKKRRPICSADLRLLLAVVDDSQPEQKQQIVGRNRLLEEGQPGFAESSANFEDR